MSFNSISLVQSHTLPLILIPKCRSVTQKNLLFIIGLDEKHFNGITIPYVIFNGINKMITLGISIDTHNFLESASP